MRELRPAMARSEPARRPTARLVLVSSVACVLAMGCGNDTPVLPALPPCPGPACECADPDDCTCDSRSECALTCGDGCRFECREDSSCASACGDDCELECVEDTDCTLYAGARSTVRCTANQCVVEVGDGSTVRCRDAASCEITCLGACDVECESGTACRYRCGDDGALMDGPGGCE
ncbi:MAG TPA: hypothetical protein RMH99_18730 [Sandaracinaceae bacterium LLY-WYZ-13_1]|nr:hypothetical protein [Sandaracinaceae bacterium LLY-WYZ-13_1]